MRGSGPIALLATIACLGAPAVGATAASADDEAAWLYHPNSVVEIELGLSEEAIEKIEAEPDKYQRGSFTLRAGGEEWSLGEVGIRLKGETSFRPLRTGKAAFKLKFDKFIKTQTFFGLSKMTLNNMVQDPSMVHETLSYEMFRTFGVPASRTGFATLRVNGAYYGVYLDLETLDKVSLPRWFGSTQHLYEGSNGSDVKPGEVGSFEVDEGGEEPGEFGDLEGLIAAANDSQGDWSEGMAGVADLEEMTRMWAVERYVGHFDGYSGPPGPSLPSNFYLHSDESGLFTMLPWGTDQTWVTWHAPIDFGEPSSGVLFNLCYADESCRATYIEALKRIYLAEPSLGLDSQVAGLAAELAPYQAEEEESRREFDEGEIELGVSETREYIARRRGELLDWLRSVVPPPRLTVSRAGSGSGRVAGSTAIDCPPTCSAQFEFGESVTLHASPASGSSFAGWSGACSGIGSCTLTMAADADATATFDANPTSGAAAGIGRSPNHGGEGGQGHPHAGAPDTRITRAVIDAGRRKAKFRFTGSGGTGRLRFLCKLDAKPMSPCASPTTYRRIRPGRHTFRVEARDATGRTDPRPALRRFRIPR